MKGHRQAKAVRLLLLLGLAAALQPLGRAVAQTAPPPGARLDDLGWLAGSWSGEIRGAGSATRFETHYTSPAGGVILSVSKALTGEGKLRWFEFERFEVRDGVLQVTPQPGGKGGVSFTLVEYDAAARKAVFANAAHDYPTRITYQRLAEDRLRFLVEGATKDDPVMEFLLSRLP